MGEGGPRTLVNGSAVGYYGNRYEEVDESALPGTGFLAEVCQDWERAALAAQAHGVRVVLLRTGVVACRRGRGAATDARADKARNGWTDRRGHAVVPVDPRRRCGRAHSACHRPGRRRRARSTLSLRASCSKGCSRRRWAMPSIGLQCADTCVCHPVDARRRRTARSGWTACRAPGCPAGGYVVPLCGGGRCPRGPILR